MSNVREDNWIPETRQHRPVPAAYREGAVPIAIPKNPSTPVSKTPPVPFVRLLTGPPVDLSSDDDLPPPSSTMRSRRTPSSTSKPSTVDSTPQKQPKTPTSTSTTKLLPTSSPLSPSTPPNGSHSPPHDAAESFSASRLASLIPLPFIASASDSRRNAILPPSAPRPTPTRYTILFDAAHALIMHQSVLKGATAAIQSPSTSPNPGSSFTSDPNTQLLHELTKISHRQAKYILKLETENVALRKVAAAALPKVANKRKRRRKLSGKEPPHPPADPEDPNPNPQLNNPAQQDPVPTPRPEPHTDSYNLTSTSTALTEEQQREQRAQKLARVQRQQARLMMLLESEDEDDKDDV